MKAALASPGAHFHPSRRDPAGDPVPNSILHQWLEDEPRDQRVAHSGLDVKQHSQPVAVARLLNLGVALQQGDLLGEGGLHPGAAPQGEPEHLAQSGKEPVGPARVLPYQRRDRVQGIEQEMRLELRAQHVQTSLRQLPRVGRGGDRAPARFPGVRRRLGRGHDEEVEQEVGAEVAHHAPGGCGEQSVL